MTPSTQTWSVVIFGYNERESLPRVVGDVVAVMEKMRPPEWEIIIVDDGSTDGAADVARAQAAARPDQIRAICFDSNQGIGQALLAGYHAARFENLTAVPADGQFRMEELLGFPNVPPRSFVSFCREAQTGYSLFRLVLSRVNKAANSWVLGVKFQDVNWVKIYKRADLLRLPLFLSSSLVESEICAKLVAGGAQLFESPSVYAPRLAGKSHAASWNSLVRVARDTMVLNRVMKAHRLQTAKA